MKQKTLTLLLALLVSTISFAQSGTCGDNLTWTLDNGTLTISGTGEMKDYGENYYNVYYHEYAPWHSYLSSITSVVISDGVTSIGYNAFEGCSNLTSVTIPNSVTIIGKYAFYCCSSLTSVTIPNSVTSIGGGAFSSCSSLTSVTIPNSVTSIEGGAFSSCSSLTSVTIPNSVTSIEGSAFYNCSSLTSIEIPNSVTTIGKSAFYGCNGLTSVNIPNSVTNIEDQAFTYCSGLTSVTIGKSVTSIGDLVFSHCSELTSVVWNAKYCKDFPLNNTPFYYEASSYGYTYGSSYNFDIRDKITSFTFGEEVQSIPASLCYGLKNLTSVTIPNSVTNIGKWAFRDCKSLTSVTIPNSVTSIGIWAFRNCSGLTSVSIGNSVTSIEGRTFADCTNLQFLSLGENINNYSDECFSNCQKLKTIYNYRTRPAKLGEKVFDGVDYFDCTLYVLAGSVDMYKSTGSDWKDFYFVQPIGAAAISTDGATVTPYSTTADVVWPVIEGAASYEILIENKDGIKIFSLLFNANGQLTQIDFSAPSRKSNNIPEQVQQSGFSFTVTGLERASKYTIGIYTRDYNNNIINALGGTFYTEGYDFNFYTVTFLDKEGNVLDIQTVREGKNATAPEVPDVEGYHFINWDTYFRNVQSDLMVTAIYAINTYTVTFLDWDDTVLKSEEVEHGNDATAPDDPIRNNYTFTGWDKAYDNITSDLNVLRSTSRVLSITR